MADNYSNTLAEIMNGTYQTSGSGQGREALADPTMGGSMFDFNAYRVDGDKWKKAQEMNLALLRKLTPLQLEQLKRLGFDLSALESANTAYYNQEKAQRNSMNNSMEGLTTFLASNPALAASLRESMQYGALSDANKAGNDAYIMQNDPSRRLETRMGVLQGLSGFGGQATQGVLGRVKEQKEENPLFGLAGAALGGWASSGFK